MSNQTDGEVIAPLIPIDAFSQELNLMAWRMTQEETRAMEAMFHKKPYDRVICIVQLASRVAQRDPAFRDFLRTSTITQNLRKMEFDRRVVIADAETAVQAPKSI